MQKALVSIAVAASMGLGATAAQAAILDDVKAKGGERPFLVGLVTALANPFAIAFWLGTFLTALPATAPDHLYARIFGLIILQSLIWYSSLAILFSTAMRGRTFGTTRLLRGITAGAMIAAGLNALIPG